VGVLSGRLAARTDVLISADFSALAVLHARKRLAPHHHVDVRQLSVPAEWPNGTFDLIVISELATYLSDEDLNALVERTIGSLEPDATLLLVHFRPDTGTPHTAADVHDRFRCHPHLIQQASHQDEQFILDVFGRTANHDVP
jgi:SAM-dependent methyltransferase